MRKTKIVCTLGPAVDSEEAIRELIIKGMNVARFNFSHGTHETHKAMYDMFVKVRDETGIPVASILDTKGPEVRIKSFAEGPTEIKKGNVYTLTTEDIPGDDKRVSITYKNLPGEIRTGQRILIDDGQIELLAVEISHTEIKCIVLNGGTLKNNKSINLPDCNINLPALTAQDEADIEFACENDFDFIAASFIRRATDVRDIRRTLDKYGGQDIRIISKIENREGVDNIDEIIDASDAIMVARGDLGVEIPFYEVPLIQKTIISRCIMRGKPAITATQMLDSMERNPRPTRAEASDVANAVFDGTSCVMLSGETAAGKYPIESVATMVDIVNAAENGIDYWKNFRERSFEMDKNITNAISHACCTTAMSLNANAIVTVTRSGHTARMISRFRPQCPIAAVTVTKKSRRQLAMSWGVYTALSEDVTSTDELFTIGVQNAVEMKLVSEGDIVVITAGVPVGQSGTTNLIKAHIV